MAQRFYKTHNFKAILYKHENNLLGDVTAEAPREGDVVVVVVDDGDPTPVEARAAEAAAACAAAAA